MRRSVSRRPSRDSCKKESLKKCDTGCPEAIVGHIVQDTKSCSCSHKHAAAPYAAVGGLSVHTCTCLQHAGPFPLVIE